MNDLTNPFDINNFSLFYQTVGNPGANTNLTQTVPINARSQLALVSFTLTTDANVASRYILIYRNRDGSLINLAHSYLSHTASKAINYICFFTAGISMGTLADAILLNLPNVPLFLQGDILHIDMVNKQAGDQLSTIRLEWKLWPYDQ